MNDTIVSVENGVRYTATIRLKASFTIEKKKIKSSDAYETEQM